MNEKKNQLVKFITGDLKESDHKDISIEGMDLNLLIGIRKRHEEEVGAEGRFKIICKYVFDNYLIQRALDGFNTYLLTPSDLPYPLSDWWFLEDMPKFANRWSAKGLQMIAYERHTTFQLTWNENQSEVYNNNDDSFYKLYDSVNGHARPRLVKIMTVEILQALSSIVSKHENAAQQCKLFYRTSTADGLFLLMTDIYPGGEFFKRLTIQESLVLEKIADGKTRLEWIILNDLQSLGSWAIIHKVAYNRNGRY